MDIERPHRTSSTPTTTSELFICFTSRLSKSSSMRLSSKSILSPSHTHNNDTKASQNHTLSTSLSRRLRHNGSLRGAQSPAMFPSKKNNNNNRGSSSSGFAENPEPSSPKVTCIGQVRVKTKKQGKKMKMRACRTSKRLSGGGGGGGSCGEASFRRIESGAQEGSQNQNQQASSQEFELNHRNQRWVHLPLTICEALRAFGSEFSCLFPCKSSCFSSGLCGGSGGGGNNVKREERENSANSSSCAVFRWLVSLQEGEDDDEKRRDIELVVGGDEDDDVDERERRVVMERECSRRRSIFDDMEFDDLFQDLGKNNNNGVLKNEEDEEEEEGRRRSLCVPPKNALLLMRCRSDPMKMASLSRKLWDPPLPQEVDVVVDHDDNDEVKVQEERENVVEKAEEVKLEEEKTEVVEHETEEIEDETKEIEDKTEEFEEKIETLGDLNEEMGEMLDDDELGEEKIETLADFVAEEEEFQEIEHKQEEEKRQEERETEEKQSIEIQEEEKCEIFEESQFMDEETLLKEDEITGNECSIDAITVEEKVENGVEDVVNEAELVTNSEQIQQVKEEKEESSDLSTTMSSNSTLNSSEESTAESKEPEFEEEEKTTLVEVERERRNSVEEERKSIEESNKLILSKIDEKPNDNKPPKLPDCLLLMMCEPKLSMEVSKETWVCSTDFIRWLPERHHSKKVTNTNTNTNTKTDGSDESTVAKTKKKPAMVGPPVQPARSSISFPAGSVANMIEQKLVKAGGYEPLILTRCKSAPMRSTAKIEPHRPATFGVGKAGVGF